MIKIKPTEYINVADNDKRYPLKKKTTGSYL